MREEKRREQRRLWDSHCPFFDRQLIVNNKFYDKFHQWDFFIVNRSLWEKKIVVTFHWSRQVVIGNENFNPRNGILGALMGLFMNFAHCGLVWIMRIYFFDIYEVGRIDIFSAGRIRPVVLRWKLWISIIEDIGIVLKTVLPWRQSN